MATEFRIGNNDEKHTGSSVTVVLDENVEFRISVNKFGELAIQKAQYGEGETSIIIRPNVSNEIRIS